MCWHKIIKILNNILKIKWRVNREQDLDVLPKMRGLGGTSFSCNSSVACPTQRIILLSFTIIYSKRLFDPGKTITVC